MAPCLKYQDYSMKFYTFYTPSHKTLYDNYFLPSFPHEDMELITDELDQECPSGTYREDGWSNTMRRKLELIIRGIKENKDDFIVHGDCDIQFFADPSTPLSKILLSELGDNDIAFQNDGTKFCAGFFVCKCNEEILRLFTRVLSDLNLYPDDQEALNSLLPQFGVSHECLSSRFYTCAMDNNWRRYEGHEHIPVNAEELRNVVMHHANYTMGVDNKIKLLNRIRDLK